MEDELTQEKLDAENLSTPIKLDYKLKDIEARRDLVEQLIAATPAQNLTNRYLEILGDYIMGGITKEEKRQKIYLTDNRLSTINKRETSYEGLVEKFENGEDGIYNLITHDKNALFQKRDPITPQDIEEIPGLRDLCDAIAIVESQFKAATGRRKYLLKQQLIEMHKDQYILKGAHRSPMAPIPAKHIPTYIDLSETRYIDENGEPQSTGLVSFFNPLHISAILCHYNALKIETAGRYQDDFFYMMEDFDHLMRRTLDQYPVYKDLTQMKIDGRTNLEIQAVLQEKHNIKHSVEYISALWRNKIPKLIAEQEKNDYLVWYYTNVSGGPFKRCSCCGRQKPAHPRFFTRNNTSKDGLYSICKECRTKRRLSKNS